jgi:hypothetical protein
VLAVISNPNLIIMNDLTINGGNYQLAEGTFTYTYERRCRR